MAKIRKFGYIATNPKPSQLYNKNPAISDGVMHSNIVPHECASGVCITFYFFRDDEILPYMPRFFVGPHTYRSHVPYNAVAYSHIPEIELSGKFQLVPLIFCV